MRQVGYVHRSAEFQRGCSQAKGVPQRRSTRPATSWKLIRETIRRTYRDRMAAQPDGVCITVVSVDTLVESLLLMNHICRL